MAITIKLTANATTGAGVDFNADLLGHFDGYVPYQMPIFLPENAENTTQILHLDTPTEGSEADTRVVLLEGQQFLYTFSNHSVSGTIETIHLGTLGNAWDADTGDLVTDSGVVTSMADSITLSGLDIENPVAVKGEVHEIVAGLMGGGLDGTTVDAQPVYDVIWSEAHILRGSSGNDRYVGTTFNDKISGGGGNDRLSGAAGNDKISGGGGRDVLLGGGGKDTLNGNGGADKLKGGGGTDKLIGGAGADKLFGQGGKDWLDGGAGADLLNGGKGADTFHFARTAHADGDRIADFNTRQGDVISLDAIDAREDVKGNQAFDLIGDDAFSGRSGELRVYNDGGNTLVAGDTDGDGLADFEITLNGLHTLSASDFIL